MSDEFHDPVWASTKKGGGIGGCVGCSLGILVPWGALALALIFYDDRTEIGALIPLLPLVLAPLGYIVFGLIGMGCGALVGVVQARRIVRDGKHDIPVDSL